MSLRVARILAAIALVVVVACVFGGYVLGYQHGIENHPSEHCAEDEVWSWIGIDTRGCVHIDRLIGE